MSPQITALCKRLHAAGKSIESISRTVSLPVYDVARAVL